jgi:DnaJ-class molecular chaperone
MALKRYEKSKPLGVCSVCRDFTAEHVPVNHRCTRVRGGKRCSRNYRSSLTAVWRECPACHETGRVGSLECSACGGWGWLLHGIT